MAPRLLVSVFELGEVEAALAGGADIVDVKNPAEGSLGAPEPGLLRAVRARTGGRALLSAALGDAPHLPGTLALAAAGAAACAADYAKVGLLGSARPEQAEVLLRAVQQAAAASRASMRVVAVAYADAARVGALPPRELPRVASRAGVYGVMLDTAVKEGTTTLQLLGEAGLRAFLDEAHGLGLQTALAGALRPEEIPRLAGLRPGILGVRGSACDGGRAGRVSATRVRALREAIDAASGAGTGPKLALG
jgi:hypothetical protein